MPTLPLAKPEQHKPALLPVGRDLVRRAMQDRGLSVTALAAQLGISRKHVAERQHQRKAWRCVTVQHVREIAMGVDPALLVCLLKRGSNPEPAPYGSMKGTIEILGDPTEPMEHWEMLED